MLQALENKIPPPIVLLISLILIRVVAAADYIYSLSSHSRIMGAAGLVLLGLGVAVAAVYSFRDVQTTVNPLKPESASSLVSNGVFRFSRNPMYLGMALIALAAVVYYSSVLSLVVVILLIVFLTRFQIIPEERAMRQLFPDEFEAYRTKVRRWI